MYARTRDTEWPIDTDQTAIMKLKGPRYFDNNKSKKETNPHKGDTATSQSGFQRHRHFTFRLFRVDTAVTVGAGLNNGSYWCTLVDIGDHCKEYGDALSAVSLSGRC